MLPVSHRNPNAAPPRLRKRARRRPDRRDWIAGTLVELDPAGGTITVRVHDAGRPVAGPGDEVTLDAPPDRVRATDGDGDGRPSLTDLFPGDRVHVTLRRRSRRRPLAWRVRQQSPGARPGALRGMWEAERVAAT
jgi:hypothetical protein